MTSANLSLMRGRLIVALEWMAVGLGGLLLAVTVWDVGGRYLLGAPLFGGSEMVQYLMGAFVFCGLGLVSARDSHVAVDIFSPWFAKASPRLTRTTIALFAMFGLGAIAWQMAASGLDALVRGDRSLVLELPIGAVLLSYAGLGAVAAFLHVLPERST